MEIYIDGKRVAKLPELSPEQRLHNTILKLRQFWNTSLRNFWKSVYIRVRYEEQKKAGMNEHASTPANNHDGKPDE